MADKAHSIVGLREIATLLEVQPRTPHVWKYRGLMPPEDYESINCSVAWDRSHILRWAAETGRLPESLQDEYDRLPKSRK